MKFCIDCKHLEDHLCMANLRPTKVDLVTGKAPVIPVYSAKVARDLENVCGVGAKLFDPKLMKPGQMPQRFLSSDAPKKPNIYLTIAIAPVVAITIMAATYFFS